MDRSPPSANKFLYKKWQLFDKELHHRNLREAKPTLDLRIRENFSHIRTKAKKDQLLEDRFTEIERENRILLEKMHHIFQNKKQNTTRTLPKGSLNYGYRKKVLTQIEVENKSMLERLRNKSSCYSARIWEKDRKNTEKRLKSIGEYPYSIGERGKTAFRSIKAPSLNTNLVYKKEIPIRNRWFVIEIYMLNNDIKVKAVDIATEENFTLRISKKEAYEIMGGFRSWDSMTRYLDLENGELVLYQAKDSDVSFHQYTHNTVGHIELEDSFL